MQEALDIIESLRTKVAGRELRASYLASKQNYYDFYINLLMQLHQRQPSEGHDAAALQATERARARNLLETLVEAHADIRQGIDPKLIERERTLQQQLNAKADRFMQMLSSQHTQEQATAAKKEIETLLAEYQEVQAQIRVSSPRYAALTQPQPLGLSEIQQQVLDEDTLLLEYSLGEERSFLWAVTPTSLSSFELPRRAEIDAAARQVYELLTARNKRLRFEEAKQRSTRVAGADAEFLKAAAELSQMILGPVAGQLEKKRLLIVADGMLRYVPFTALPAPGGEGEKERRREGEKGRPSPPLPLSPSPPPALVPLIVDHEIVTLPSASVLAVLRRELAGRKPAAKTLAVLADPVFESGDHRVKLLSVQAKRRQAKPRSSQASIRVPPELKRSAEGFDMIRFERLPNTRQEAAAILTLAPPAARLKALDFDASRTTATSAELSQYRMVHFATHGLLNTEHPELSGIVLSLIDKQGQPQDGFLRAHEIYNLTLPAELVVLSGCKTGLGKEIRGEGLVGLTRGFMYAGAARVAVSLWDVNDAATAELMKRFYRAMLVEGLRPAAALRAAQVSLWKQKKWRTPYYWAAFQLQGEWK
jgi:CHAT domain-containing protein